MSGLGQLVPYFECQYPQVIPMSAEQASIVLNSGGPSSSGVGDYLSPFGWPIPQYLTPGNNRGLGCADCGCGGCSGLGQGSINVFGTTIPLSAPDGLFTGSFTSWGLEEWGIVAAGLYLLFSLIGDTKRHVRKTRKAARAYKSTQ